MRLETKAARLLTLRGTTLSVAESCTGGLLSHRLTNIPGSSDFLKLAAVTYSNDSKSRLLKVPKALISRHGAVSEPVAVRMAQGVRKFGHSDFGIGITGIAGPDGGTAAKPVGLVFIAVSTANEDLCLECLFRGSRLQIKRKAADQALKLLIEFLE